MTALATAITPGTWTVDVASSSAAFRARDLLRQPVLGTLPVRWGVVQVSPDGVPVSVVAELDLAGVSTGSSRRDADLRGHRFFAVEGSPVLRFTAGPARPDGGGAWVLPGSLALRGVDCPLEVAVELVARSGAQARVRATAVVDRRDAGIRVPRLLVGTAVELSVEASLLAPPPDDPRPA